MSEVIYGSSGDTRSELVSGNAVTDQGYLDETQIRGEIITRGLRRATRIINGYLESVYPDSVPFAAGSIPLLIDSLANDLAVCYVMRSKHSNFPPMSNETKEMYCDETKELLEKLQKREMQLPELTSTDYPETSNNMEDIIPVFDMDDVTNQGVDPDLIDDIRDEKDA